MWLRTKLLYPKDEFLRVYNRQSSESLSIPVELKSPKGNRSTFIQALIDSGATANFINWRVVHRYNIKLIPLDNPILVRNVDNTENIRGRVRFVALLAMKTGSHIEHMRFFVSDLGCNDIILGHPWLRKHNPSIDWRTSSLVFNRCFPTCQLSLSEQWQPALPVLSVLIGGIRHNPTRPKKSVRFDLTYQPPSSPTIHQTTQSTSMAANAHQADIPKTFKELVPAAYRNFATVFSEDASHSLPPRLLRVIVRSV
jgi:Retroviral aspartyl protease